MYCYFPLLLFHFFPKERVIFVIRRSYFVRSYFNERYTNFSTTILQLWHTEKKGTCSTFAVVLLYFPKWKKHLSYCPFLIPLGRRSDCVGNLNTNHPDWLIQQAECWTPIYMSQMFGKGAPKSAFLSGITNYSNAQFIWDSLFYLKHLLDSFFHLQIVERMPIQHPFYCQEHKEIQCSLLMYGFGGVISSARISGVSIASPPLRPSSHHPRVHLWVRTDTWQLERVQVERLDPTTHWFLRPSLRRLHQLSSLKSHCLSSFHFSLSWNNWLF